TTVEHAIPIPVLYDDVLTLYAMSTGSSPTHLVNYGGTFGDQMIWQKADAPNVEKLLRRFSRHDILEGLTESTARPDSCTFFFSPPGYYLTRT
ncbi:hypothetical protein BDZ89DRAFT_948270, partial [Hymenopellis radicata]